MHILPPGGLPVNVRRCPVGPSAAIDAHQRRRHEARAHCAIERWSGPTAPRIGEPEGTVDPTSTPERTALPVDRSDDAAPSADRRTAEQGRPGRGSNTFNDVRTRRSGHLASPSIDSYDPCPGGLPGTHASLLYENAAPEDLRLLSRFASSRGERRPRPPVRRSTDETRHRQGLLPESAGHLRHRACSNSIDEAPPLTGMSPHRCLPRGSAGQVRAKRLAHRSVKLPWRCPLMHRKGGRSRVRTGSSRAKQLAGLRWICSQEPPLESGAWRGGLSPRAWEPHGRA
jgi:hypothetical protein